MMIETVIVSRNAQKDSEKLPLNIRMRLEFWIRYIKTKGWDIARKHPGYHDELLQGQRWGQRSARLNRSYRIIYSIRKDEYGSFIYIEEVNKHEY